MALEVVVRPVVLPNIRPAPARSLPPADDPTKGFAEINGNGAHQLQFSYSWSASGSLQKLKETKRRVDKARVYQKDKDGTVNKDNFIDLEIANKIWMRGGRHPTADTSGAGGGTPGVGNTLTQAQLVQYFQRLKEADNIEILDRDKIKESEQ
jgi:hypothetical protein